MLWQDIFFWKFLSGWLPSLFGLLLLLVRPLLNLVRNCFKKIWPKKDFFYCSLFFGKFIIAAWKFGPEKMIDNMSKTNLIRALLKVVRNCCPLKSWFWTWNIIIAAWFLIANWTLPNKGGLKLYHSFLIGGFQVFLGYFHPTNWGEWSNLTSMLFKWVDSTTNSSTFLGFFLPGGVPKKTWRHTL